MPEREPVTIPDRDRRKRRHTLLAATTAAVLLAAPVALTIRQEAFSGPAGTSGAVPGEIWNGTSYAEWTPDSPTTTASQGPKFPIPTPGLKPTPNKQ